MATWVEHGIAQLRFQYQLDSDEEALVVAWLADARAMGLVSGYNRAPSYELSASVALEGRPGPRGGRKQRVLHRPHTYTPDLICWPTEICGALWEKHSILWPLAYRAGECMIAFEVKGAFNPYGKSGDREARINMRWLYHEHRIPCLWIVPAKLFASTWTPDLARFTPRRAEPSTKWRGCVTARAFASKHNLPDQELPPWQQTSQ